MSAIPVNLAFEDSLSEAVLKKILSYSNRDYAIGSSYSKRGYGYLKNSIDGFNNAAKGTPFIVLADLDRYECPPVLIADWLRSQRHHNLLFRVAVKEIEAWLLADREGFAKYFGVMKSRIPEDVEGITSPKEFLIQLIKKSNKKKIREDILPRVGSTAKQGRNYNSQLILFANEFWEIERARKTSHSLNRTINRIFEFEPTW